MKDFSKATPRPWELSTVPFELRGTDSAASIYGPISKFGGSPLIADISRSAGDEQATHNAELIVTAVNNFDKMKDAIETQLQIIEALIGSKRIVNLDESIAYYKQLLESLK